MFPFQVVVLLLLVPFTGFCQQDDYVLDGHLTIKNGGIFRYQITFKEKNGHFKGQSLTWLETNAHPSVTKIGGKIDRKNNLILLEEETGSTKSTSKDSNMCFISSVLKYKLQGDKFIVSGPFTGRDVDNNFCGAGTLKFEHAALNDKVLGENIVAPKPVARAAAVASTADITTTNIGIVSASAPKDMACHADSVIMYLWQYSANDTDMVSVFYNGKEQLFRYTLTKAKKQVVLPLRSVQNELTILAENDGSNPPNRARIMIAGDNKQFFFTAYNEKGKAAVITIRKQ